MKFVIEEDLEFTYGANDTRSILLYMVAERGFEDIKYDHLLAFHQLSVIIGRTALHDTIVFNDKGLLPTREKYHGISGVGKRYE
uniref:Uncharacterized protein n=1 Tax=Vitis vinifera TaxID=29760 RepID=F6H9V7_VITVI